MIGVVAELTIKARQGAAFEQIALQLQDAVRTNEPGCQLYRLFKVRETQDRYIFMEIYDDEDAVAHHRASDHFRTLGRQMGAFLEGPPKITRMDKVD